MHMVDPYFTVYRRRRRTFVSGKAPQGLPPGDRPIHARAWRIHQNRMSEEPPWERAERYRQLMDEKGYQSIRALARATGEDHSRLARLLKVLDLPAAVLAALREHSDDVRVRAYFTEKRLRQLARKNRPEKAILHSIREVLHTGA